MVSFREIERCPRIALVSANPSPDAQRWLRAGGHDLHTHGHDHPADHAITPPTIVGRKMFACDAGFQV
jgi:hypothetical protein